MPKQPWSWIYVVCFLDFIGASMIMPVFSTYLRSLGISHMNIGLLSSLYGTMQLISGPVIGSWSDVNGRKPVLCLSMLICSASYGLMGIASSFYLFVVVRCVLGSFKHTQTLSRAVIADIVPIEKQASVYGLINAFTSLSFMIGPLISGHVMETKNGFQHLTTAVLLIFTINATVVFIFANTNNIVKKEKVVSTGFLKKIALVFSELYSIEWKSFWPLFSIKFLFALSAILFFQNLGLILTNNFEVTPRVMGYNISFYGFISVLCNLYVGKVKSLALLPKTYLKCLTYTFLIMAVTFYFMYLANSHLIFIAGLIPLSASHTFSRILLMEVLLEQSDASSRGSLLGASSSTAAIARTLAPFFSGFVISWGGILSPLIFSSLIAVCASLLSVIYSYKVQVKTL